VTASPFLIRKDGVTVSLRVMPRAAKDKVAGLARVAEGEVELKIGVTAPPEDGKANAAVIKLLAKAWKVPKSSLSIIKGAADRRKVILVAGDAAELEGELTQWLARMGT
jgi:uncharacterized protein (TIGR00251 family)